MSDLSTAASTAAIVVAVVAAVRARIPVDGWRVLALAGGVALVLAVVLAGPVVDTTQAWEAVRQAVLAWVLAVGGDSWVSRLASKATSQKGP